MCGIAGCAFAPGERDALNASGIIRSLGLSIEHRGRLATGVATVNSKGRVTVRKAPTDATSFFKARTGLGTGASIATIHTRFPTEGDRFNNGNNHPIVTGRIVGTHNGVVYNDNALFRKNPEWKRYAKVDSEIIFTALDQLEDPVTALELIEGWMAVSWIDTRDPHVLHLAKGDSSPLHVAMSYEGSLYYASEAQALDKLVADGLVPEFYWQRDVFADGTILHYDPREAKLDVGAYKVAETSWSQGSSWRSGASWSGADVLGYDSGWDTDDGRVYNSGRSFISTGSKATPLAEIGHAEREFAADRAVLGSKAHATQAIHPAALHVGQRVRKGSMLGTVQFWDDDECMVEWDPSVEVVDSLYYATHEDEMDANAALDSFMTIEDNLLAQIGDD